MKDFKSLFVLSPFSPESLETPAEQIPVSLNVNENNNNTDKPRSDRRQIKVKYENH